jgi:hypothetical protein
MPDRSKDARQAWRIGLLKAVQDQVGRLTGDGLGLDATTGEVLLALLSLQRELAEDERHLAPGWSRCFPAGVVLAAAGLDEDRLRHLVPPRRPEEPDTRILGLLGIAKNAIVPTWMGELAAKGMAQDPGAWRLMSTETLLLGLLADGDVRELLTRLDVDPAPIRRDLLRRAADRT